MTHTDKVCLSLQGLPGLFPDLVRARGPPAHAQHMAALSRASGSPSCSGLSDAAHTHTHTHTHMYSRVTAQDPSSAFSWVNLCLTRRSLFHCMRPGNRKVADRPLPQSVPPREAPQPHPSPPAGAQSWQTGKGLGHWRDDVPPRPGGGTGPTPGPSCPSLLTARSRHPATPGATLPKLACPRRSDQAHLGLAQADLGLSPLGTRCRVFTGSVHPDDGQSSTVRPGVTGLV